MRKNSLIRIIVMVVVSVMLVVMSWGDYFSMKKAPVDYYKLAAGEMKEGMHITADIDMVWDYFAIEESYDTVYGIKVSKAEESARYYMLPYFYTEEDPATGEQSIYVMAFDAIVVKGDTDINVFDQIVNDTMNWWNDATGTVEISSQTYHFDGTVSKMDKEIYGYLKDYLIESGYSAEEAEGMILPYVLEEVSVTGVTVCFWIGIGLSLITLAVIIITIVVAQKNKNKSTGNSSGNNYGYGATPNSGYGYDRTQDDRYGYSQSQNDGFGYNQPQNDGYGYNQPENNGYGYEQIPEDKYSHKEDTKTSETKDGNYGESLWREKTYDD